MNSLKVKNKITLEISRYVDKDFECKDSVLTIRIDNAMIQKTGMEAESIYSMVKDIVEQDYSDIEFEEDKDDIQN